MVEMNKINVEIYFQQFILMIYLWKEYKIMKLGHYSVLNKLINYVKHMDQNLNKFINNQKMKKNILDKYQQDNYLQKYVKVKQKLEFHILFIKIK